MLKVIAFLSGLILMSFPAFAQKAGVGAWENPSYTMLEWIERGPEIGWYYNWRTDQMWYESRHRRSVEFVPMIHGRGNVNDRIVSDRRVQALLGFNEPDSSRVKMSVEEAISLWPRLEAHGLRLGSPATLQSATLGGNSWQRRFMNEVERRGLRVDFMAVHYYSTNGSVNEFRNWLIAVHREYRRPIWVTEFAFIDWYRPRSATYSQNARFVRVAIRMMEELPFVERHAWYAANPDTENGVTPQINLLDNNLRPTLVGTAFEEILREVASVRVASASGAPPLRE